MFLRLVRETPQPLTLGTPIRGPLDALAVLRPAFEGQEVESFLILALDAQHRLIGNAPIEITRGLLNTSLVHAREVYRSAIAANAAAIVLAHNHPSGDATPSADDKKVTDMLVQSGKLLDIPVHDHVIIGRGATFFSFAESGLL